MKQKFRLISSEIDLRTLETRLIQYLPHSTQMVNIVRLKLLQRFPKSNQIDIYLYEDPERNELEEPFVVCRQKPNIQSLHGVITLAPKSHVTRQMMEDFDNFIDWDTVKLFSNLHSSFAPHLKILTDQHGNRTEHPEGLMGSAYFMDIEKALKLVDAAPKVRDDGVKNTKVEVRPLCSEDAVEMIRSWEFNLPHSKGQIEEVIKSMDSRGVYVDSELASSAVLSPLGLINILHTDEKHRRKGYAEVTMGALSKSVASLGLIPGAEFEAWNDKSKKLLEKLGFEFAYDVVWMFFEK